MRKIAIILTVICSFSFCADKLNLKEPTLEYVKTKITEKIESFEIFSIDTLTPKKRLELQLSKRKDSIDIISPVYLAVVKQKALIDDSYKKYPKDKFFKESALQIKKEFDSLKYFVDGIVMRGNAIEKAIGFADSSTFEGYITNAVAKYYRNGNRAITVYDTVIVVFDEHLSVIEKKDW